MSDEPSRGRAREDEVTRRKADEAAEAPPGGRLPAARWVPAGRDAASDDAGVVLRAASALLDHPEVSGADPADLAETLAASTGTAGHAPLLRFLEWWEHIDVRERGRQYVETFDEDPGVSLFLAGGRPGASREYAERLVESWQSSPGAAGTLRRAELSDYLPLLLQVAARLPAARSALAEERPALEALASALAQRRSPFVEVVAAVLAVLPRPSRAAGRAARRVLPPRAVARAALHWGCDDATSLHVGPPVAPAPTQEAVAGGAHRRSRSGRAGRRRIRRPAGTAALRRPHRLRLAGAVRAGALLIRRRPRGFAVDVPVTGGRRAAAAAAHRLRPPAGADPRVPPCADRAQGPTPDRDEHQSLPRSDGLAP